MSRIRITEKHCNKCDGIKPIADFCKNIGAPDGYGYYCYECRKKVHKSYGKEYWQQVGKRRADKLEKETGIRYKPHRKSKRAKINSKEYYRLYHQTWYKNNKMKVKVTDQIHDSKTDMRKPNCQKCNSTNNLKHYVDDNIIQQLTLKEESGCYIQLQDYADKIKTLCAKCIMKQTKTKNKTK